VRLFGALERRTADTPRLSFQGIAGWPLARRSDPGPEYPCVPGEELRSVSMVWGCIRFIAARISALPPVVEDAEGRQYPPPLWVRQPARWCSFTDLLSGAVISLVHHGNWYVLVHRDRAQRVVGLSPLDPQQVTLEAAPNGQLIYRVNGEIITEELIHQRFIATSGNALGVGCLEAARVGIKISDAAEGYIARHFSQGAVLQVALTTKDMLPSSSKRDIAAQLRAKTVGADNAFAPLVLDGGLEVKHLAMTSEQAQFIQLAKWSDARIAAQIYGIQPSLVGVVEPGSQLTYHNLQDREGQVWRDALGPVASRIEQALSLPGLLPRGRKLRLDNSGILLGAARDRISMAASMSRMNRDSGMVIYTPDEIRAVTGHPARITDVQVGDEIRPTAGRQSINA